MSEPELPPSLPWDPDDTFVPELGMPLSIAPATLAIRVAEDAHRELMGLPDDVLIRTLEQLIELNNGRTLDDYVLRLGEDAPLSIAVFADRLAALEAPNLRQRLDDVLSDEALSVLRAERD